VKRELGLIGNLTFGALATIGGWWFLLTMFNLAPPLTFSYLNLIVNLCAMGAVLGSLLAAGPYILYDSLKQYRTEEAA